MTTWMARGLVFAAGMVFLRLVQGALINASPTNAGTISMILVVLFGVAASIWGLLDGSADARANPDPDRRRDLAMRWLMSGLVAGVLSGAVAWVISLFYGPIYVDGLIPEVIVFSAFTALIVFLPAIFAVAIGRMIVDRRRPRSPPAIMSAPTCSRPSARTTTTSTPAGASRTGGRSTGKPSGNSTRTPSGAPTITADRRGLTGRGLTGRGSAVGGQVPQCQQVALHPESDDHAGGHRADVGMVPKFLPRVHIGDVHLDQRRR